MPQNSVDSLLMITIVAGIVLSVANLILALVNGQASRVAAVKQAAGIREMYQRTYQRGRRLVSIARSGKTERRRQPTNRLG
jgi:hypothetical protein